MTDGLNSLTGKGCSTNDTLYVVSFVFSCVMQMCYNIVLQFITHISYTPIVILDSIRSTIYETGVTLLF